MYTTVNNPDDQIRLQNFLTNIQAWSLKSGMKLNVNKAKCINVTNEKEPYNFTYKSDGTEIAVYDEVKYLGVTLTSNLNWEPHITSICERALRKLSFLKRRLRDAPSSVKLNTYKTLVRPVLEYADIIWDPFQKYLTDQIDNIQKLAARFIYSDHSRYSSAASLVKRANLQPLRNCRIISKLKFICLLHHGHYKIPCSRYLQDPSKHSNRTNHCKTIRQPFSRVNSHKYSLFPQVILYLNKLPGTVANCATLDSFVKNIETITFSDT